MLDVHELPNDVDQLKRLVLEHRSHALTQQLEIERLKIQLSRLRRWKFGRSSDLYVALDSPIAREGIHRIDELYGIETEIRGLPPELCYQERQTRAAPLLGGEQSEVGRWIIEGDLASYFDTVHHRLLMRAVRKRIVDQRLLALLWRLLKAGCTDRGLFRAASEGVPQGGVLSPLLSNIMLNEFDQSMEANYLNKKARKDRWAWNFGILKPRPITVRENRQWKPAVAYCRYADDFTVVVKGTRAHAQEVREACRAFLEGKLKLTLNMAKTHITHVNDGFVFLGHRITRKRGPGGRMRPVTTIPWARYRGLAQKPVQELSSNYSVNSIDKVERLNRILAGWANFYQFTDYTATVFQRVDRIVLWKLGYWLARKHRATLKALCRRWVRAPEPGRAITWVLRGRNSRGAIGRVALRRLVTSRKGQFRWRGPEGNPYILREEERNTFESRYADLVFAFSNT